MQLRQKKREVGVTSITMEIAYSEARYYFRYLITKIKR